MQVVGALFLVASALLAVAGVAKVRRPRPTAEAIRSVGLPSSLWLVRCLGAAELLVGGSALLTGDSRVAALVAAAYVGFAVFVAASMVAPQRSGCGCFGESVVPPGPIHLVANVVAATIASLVANRPVAGLVDVVADSPWAGIVLVVGLAVVVLLLVGALTALPESRRALRGQPG